LCVENLVCNHYLSLLALMTPLNQILLPPLRLKNPKLKSVRLSLRNLSQLRLQKRPLLRQR